MAETAEFPVIISTQLYTVVPRTSTNLTANIDNAVTTIPVDSTTGFPAKCFISLDSETMFVTSLDATNFYVSRGYNDSTPASHLDNAAVKLVVAAAYVNRLTVEMLATQNYIGKSGDTRNTTLTYKINNLWSFTQGGSTQVTNLNAQFLGGSTAGQFLASGATNINAAQLASVNGASIIENDIEFTPDSFNLNNNNPAATVEVIGTSLLPRVAKAEFGATDAVGLPPFKMPRTYNGGTITWSIMYCSSTASSVFDIGIQAAIAGADASYQPTYGAAIYFGTITCSATTGNLGFTSKDIVGASLGLTNSKMNFIRLVAGTTAAVQIVNTGLRYLKG